jgi:signal transduction histidine kinase
MSHLRTVGARLSLALLLVVALALALVYVIVVPSLQSRLVDSKLTALEKAAPVFARRYAAHPFNPDFLDAAASRTNARALLLIPISQDGQLLTVEDDSHQSATSQESNPFETDAIAVRALAQSKQTSGTVTRLGERYAEVATPLRGTPYILLFTAPLHDALKDVALVRNRILVAGALALVVALLLGYGAASAFARRIRRLERAADRIAGGDFDEPVADSGLDELGELSRAFERMRARLARLDHARREFVANASHELRTPLFSLGGFLELLTDDDELDEPTRREFLQTMNEQVRRLQKLAEDLLDLSRLDAGRLRVETGLLDLVKVADAAAAEFQAVARATHHPLEVVRNGPVPAFGDEERVLQIARVLIDNALVHTSEGTAIRVSPGERDGSAVLTVRDEGPPIPEDQHTQLFERFYRLAGTRTSGSGLGLAIARELAELMDGSIELESAAGANAFSLVLPKPDAAESFSRENADAFGAPLQ